MRCSDMDLLTEFQFIKKKQLKFYLSNEILRENAKTK
jgi:hypothetical protein